ncbi:MAG: outer membrane protein assembly factor BamE [Planctomycetes bacterium]|nr:outer membrane protein assembly factor BamE [Planctomycetota bacterium]
MGMKRHNRDGIAQLLVLFVLLLALFVLFAIALNVVTGERAFRRSFKKVKVGMTQGQVLHLLGKPDQKSATFHVAQYEGFEEEYRKAKASGSRHYFFWRRGADTVYAIGFDEQGTVRFKAAGGT